MILSRTLAKSRIAAGVRPGWLLAWGPVAFDFAVFCLYATLVLGQFMRSVTSEQLADGPTVLILILILLIFVPLQITMILSSLWAAKSRWREKDGN